MLNAFCVDLEDYFCGNDLGIPFEDWPKYPPRIERGTRVIVQILERRRVRATFFVVSWFAEKYPALVRELAARGHEIACHTHTHRTLDQFTPDAFRDELRRSLELLRQVSGQRVVGFRAPSWSLHPGTAWALPALASAGILYDSSIVPWCGMRHVRGWPDMPRKLHMHPSNLALFPATVCGSGPLTWPLSLGTAIRLAPAAVTARLLRRFHRTERAPGMLSVHPCEFDPEQPRLKLDPAGRFFKYSGLGNFAGKIDRLVSEFSFGTMADTLRNAGVPTI